MDYFSKFLRTNNQPSFKSAHDYTLEFHKSWSLVKNTLISPDERQLAKGINSTDVPAHLKSMVDSLVWESARTEDGDTGACLEYLLKHDVLGTLVQLSESDRPFGIQAEVLRAVQNMVILLDEQFLVHSAVHRAVLRLLRNCVGDDDLQEKLDGRNKVMGAARNSTRGQPSEYEEDLVNLLCILCSRIRTHRELLMIFFHDKNWFHTEPSLLTEKDGEPGDDDEEAEDTKIDDDSAELHADCIPSPTPSEVILTSALDSSAPRKPEYEFLLFNYLLRFVHREGQIGDFARAGLLFLIDVAMSPHGSTSKEAQSSSGPSSPDPVTDAALALAEYILDGDFSEVLAAGLGAVYSLLPSKLEFRPRVVTDAAAGTGMVLGSGNATTEEDKEREALEQNKRRAMGLEDASNPDFKLRLDHFLKLLEFLQDVIRRNATHDSANNSFDASTVIGTAIVQSILDAVQRIFLENVLYPSILECSDNDGSAVAVMSYIEIMIRTSQEGQFSDLLVRFLTSEDNDEIRRPSRPHAMLTLSGNSSSSANGNRQAKLQRRKSSAMLLLEMEAPESRRRSEYFTSMGRFTLKDLLITNMGSEFQPTATAALQLFNSLLSRHPRLCVDKLLIVIPDENATCFPSPATFFTSSQRSPYIPHDDAGGDGIFTNPVTTDNPVCHAQKSPTVPSSSLFAQPETTYSTHEREMGLYFTLVSRFDPSHSSDAFSTGYEHYLHDALSAISDQSSFHYEDTTESRKHLKHRLNPNDPFISILLESLRTFFTNTPDFNIALTGVLATLAIHPDRSLAGWLTFASDDEPRRDQSQDDLEYPDGSDDRSVDFRIDQLLASESNRLPAASVDEQSRPLVHVILYNLAGQLERYRQVVEKFDDFLLERRQGLLFSENLTDALTLALEVTDECSPAPPSESPTQRPRGKVKASSFVSFLTPKKRPKPSPVPSEPSTPPTSNKKLAASPFGPHYQRTSAIVIEPFVAPIPASSSWTPLKRGVWSIDEEDVFGSSSQWSDANVSVERPVPDDNWTKDANGATRVTLSHLLDNVVILEESIKELVAIIHARRSLGIDSVRYV